MVIVQTKSGQLANRLFAFSSFIANAVEHRYPLFNPTFDEYVRYFPKLRAHDFGGHQISLNSSIGLRYPAFRWITGLMARLAPRSPWHVFISDQTEQGHFDLNSESFIELARSHKRAFMKGWEFRDFINHQKHSGFIRDLFTPDPEVIEWVTQRLATMRSDPKDLVVGVHIRRGDYAQWEGGKYFYNNEDYHRWMLQLDQLASDRGRKTVFVVCSNESLEPDEFDGIALGVSGGDLIQDLYLLAGCDLLIGPPSTYSMWASFYGEVPLYHLKSRADVPSFDVLSSSES